VKKIENEIEKTMTFKWELRQASLPSGQESFVEDMADFLVKNSDAFITIHPQVYAEKEKEYILLFEAKKKYYLSLKDKNDKLLTEDDSERIDQMSIRDASFIRFVSDKASDSLLFTIQQKCSKLVSVSEVDKKFNQLNSERGDAFLSYFKKKGVEKRIKMQADQNVIPYNGFSFYKIEYKGETPESLIKAYRKMNELNGKATRKLFENIRITNKAALYDVKKN